MDKQKINTLLKRQILDGSGFDQYIDQPTNQNQQLDKGDTFFTTKMMKIWALRHYKQVSRLAPILKKPTIAETCANIHSFLYNFIQYEIDGTLQNLRSPANSWYTARESGIDCKSYSIFASTILLNLGIKHYIRQIKQPKFNPTNFSHVYIVVPIDQVSGSLDSGNYCIDGTLKTSTEPRYTTAKDIYMAELPHLGLNGAGKKKAAAKKKSAAKKKTAPKKTVKKAFFIGLRK
jgi:hypothetical protein